MGLQTQAIVLQVPGFTVQPCLRLRGGSCAFPTLTQSTENCRTRPPPAEKFSAASPVGATLAYSRAFYVYYFSMIHQEHVCFSAVQLFSPFLEYSSAVFPEISKAILICETTKTSLFSIFCISKSRT